MSKQNNQLHLKTKRTKTIKTNKSHFKTKRTNTMKLTNHNQ